jgi:hypothetical protein
VVGPAGFDLQRDLDFVDVQGRAGALMNDLEHVCPGFRERA